ncbi:MAG: hypothetical protein JWM28_93 [Chitinophagaceae bacterium]|nr:hypothetical protein [Chitinophagaceae bacterium]
MNKYILLVLLLLITARSRAGMYAEHKKIGDLAFISFVKENHLESFFRNTLKFGQYGIDYKTIPFSKNPFVMNYYNGMFALSDSQYQYSYGDLSAMSGDHSLDPFQLFEGLFTKGYYNGMTPGLKLNDLVGQLQLVRNLQNTYIDKNTRNTIGQPINESNYSNLKYIWLANEDQSHFLRPGESLDQMLTTIDYSLLDSVEALLSIPYDDVAAQHARLLALRKSIDKKILQLNNSSKYAILHAYALNYMNNSAIAYCNKDDSEGFRRNFQFALIFNAYADHYLQDAFSSGHMPVKRSIIRGLDNKGIHDYYSRNGIDVENELGMKWRTYGDNFYDSITFYKAIKANYESLNELWEYFNKTVETYSKQKLADPFANTPESMVTKVLTKKTDISTLPQMMHKEFAAYKYEPVPLNSTRYKHDILLKKGSKNGFFYEVGANCNVWNNNAYIGWNIGAGLGLDHTKYDRDTRKNINRCGKNKETVYWRAISVNFSSTMISNVSVNTLTLGPQITYLDRLTAEIDLGGILSNSNYFLCRPVIGYEFKTIRCPLAPSVKAFYNITNNAYSGAGLMLNLRLY